MFAVVIDESTDEFIVAARHQPDPEGDGVLVDVKYSSINYKDTMCARPQSRVRRAPVLVAGVDGVGVVASDSTGRFAPGTLVFASGSDIGTGRNGGFATRLLAPADCVTAFSSDVDPRALALMGTAGWTAMASLMALEHHGLTPDSGDVLVTGATGGVGSVAVALAAAAGYRVVASSGSTEHYDWLRALGAHEIVGRDELTDKPDRVLGTERWAGAIDGVGGQSLAHIVRSLAYGGAVAASGLVAGSELHTTVYPFITRGVSILGIDSVLALPAHRDAVWNRLVREVATIETELLVDRVVSLDEVPLALADVAAGAMRGRIVVDCAVRRVN
jgi:acrylyl-CoA reductase (NADPH)